MTREKRLKQKAVEVAKRLEEKYSSECALLYQGEPWKLLVLARLSAQCTDKRVNIVSIPLFEKYPTLESMAECDLAELEEIIKPCGLYRMKAANLKDSSKMLVENYDSKLPDTMEELLKFPGVGRKIANLLLGDIFGKPAVVCDTHCIRICGRLGMYPEKEKNPEKIEKILTELINPEEGSDFCHRIVFFGREVCSARSPMCACCPLSDICEHNLRAKNKELKNDE